MFQWIVFHSSLNLLLKECERLLWAKESGWDVFRLVGWSRFLLNYRSLSLSEREQGIWVNGAELVKEVLTRMTSSLLQRWCLLHRTSSPGASRSRARCVVCLCACSVSQAIKQTSSRTGCHTKEPPVSSAHSFQASSKCSFLSEPPRSGCQHHLWGRN